MRFEGVAAFYPCPLVSRAISIPLEPRKLFHRGSHGPPSEHRTDLAAEVRRSSLKSRSEAFDPYARKRAPSAGNALKSQFKAAAYTVASFCCMNAWDHRRTPAISPEASTYAPRGAHLAIISRYSLPPERPTPRGQRVTSAHVKGKP